MKKMMLLFKNWYFSVQKALIYYTFNKSHHNSFILLVLSHVANFRYVANFRFLTLSLTWEHRGPGVRSKITTMFYVRDNYLYAILKSGV